MIPYLFPVWGPAVPVVAPPVVPPPAVVPPVPGWGYVAAPAQTKRRLERLYPHPLTVGNVDFVYRVQTQFPLVLATGNSVFLRSDITQP